MSEGYSLRLMIVLMRAWLGAAMLCAVAATPTTAALAQAPDTVLLEELTWTEVRDAVRAGKTTIIVPAGGTEQNGPHMALGKHNARVKVLSERIARALGDALVAPVIAYVPEGALAPPTGHMRFAGTITAPEDAFEKVLESAARSFKLHGFRHIVLLGDHGSTQAGQKAVAARLNREWASTPARVLAIEEYYRASEVEVAQLLKARGYRDAELGRHAGLTDTALTLATAPGLVRADRLRPGRDGDGVDGDPSRATAELGRAGVELIVTRTVEAIRKSIPTR
jgi:creatinine amidohydrolase